MTLKHVFHHPNPNLHFVLFDLTTSDDFEVTRGHQRLSGVLKSIADAIHPVSSASFSPDTVTLPGEANDDW